MRRRQRWASVGWDMYAIMSFLNAVAIAAILLVAMIFMLVIGR